jgi:ATP-binding cassette subfamily B protein
VPAAADPPPAAADRLRRAARARSRRWLVIAGLLPAAGAGPAITAVALSLAAGALPAGFIFWTSSLLARLPELARLPASGRAAALGLAAAPAIAALFGQQVLAPAQIALAELLTRRVDERCLRQVMAASIGATPLAALEQQSVLDRFSDVRAAFDGASPTPGAAVAGGVALVARYAQLLGAVALVAGAAGPLAGVLVGLTAVTIRFGQRESLARFAARWDQLAGGRRRISYLADLGTGLAAAKELRVLGLVSWLQDRHRGAARAYLAPMWAQRRQIFLRPFLGYSAVALAGGGAALVLLARGAVTGRLGLFSLSVAVQGVLVAVRFGVFFPDADIKTQHGFETYQAMLAATAPAGPARRPAARPRAAGPAGPLRSGIRCEQVVFGYGAAGPPVLDGLDLELPAGRSTAIVGLNGAGKTTLIKLLAGLYQPRQGRILADGADLAGLDQREWRRRLAIVFQDYVRYELSAAANIWMGAPDAPRDRPALLAAAGQAGALDVLAGLPGGLDTPLSARYRGGTDLSGGQWQRIALARAFFAVQAGATVLILDEPTAHLDVRAETDFYDGFLELTRGLTTVLVSHRFASVRRADAIVVLEHGRVIESGGHDDLAERGGRYARLFRAQADRFAGPAAPGPGR